MGGSFSPSLPHRQWYRRVPSGLCQNSHITERVVLVEVRWRLLVFRVGCGDWAAGGGGGTAVGELPYLGSR